MARGFRPIEPKKSSSSPPPVVSTNLLEAEKREMAEVTAEMTADEENVNSYKIEPHVEVEFDDLFREPEGTKENILDKTIGENIIRGFYATLFRYIKLVIFFVLSIVVGFLASICFAVLTSVTHILHVWILQPTLMLTFSWCRLIRAFNKVLVRTFCEPCCHAIGQSLAHIRGQFRTDVSDVRGRATVTYGAIKE